jgi:hypothetical protein
MWLGTTKCHIFHKFSNLPKLSTCPWNQILLSKKFHTSFFCNASHPTYYGLKFLPTTTN